MSRARCRACTLLESPRAARGTARSRYEGALECGALRRPQHGGAPGGRVEGCGMLRYDITTNDWVIFAPARARRPAELRETRPATVESQPQICPFCPGQEAHTAPEVYADRSGTPADGPGWRVRVVPNRFPALRIEEEVTRVNDGPLFRSMGSCGAHEVIVESPEHDRHPGDQPSEQLERVLRALQFRHIDLMRDPRFQTIMIFKNHGPRAGTTLRHPHWQLIATPVVPHLLRIQYGIATQYFDQFGTCLYCDLLRQELAAGDRLLAENQHFAAILPYASRLPFETWIMPKSVQSSFGKMNPGMLPALGEMLKLVLLKLRAGLGDPDFNITIKSAPRGEEDEEYFLWHLQLLPRLILPAGFELGSGMWINTVIPEEAAGFLRGLDEADAVPPRA